MICAHIICARMMYAYRIYAHMIYAHMICAYMTCAYMICAHMICAYMICAHIICSHTISAHAKTVLPWWNGSPKGYFDHRYLDLVPHAPYSIIIWWSCMIILHDDNFENFAYMMKILMNMFMNIWKFHVF
jgi:hypothetical protein